MSAENFPAALAFTLHQEGGFSDDPHDSGGATMNGITLREFQTATSNPTATTEELKAITPTVRDAIYQTNYWATVNGDELPAGVDLSVFDMGVNAGPGTSVKLLQRVLGVTDDGIVGPDTLAAVKGQDPSTLIQQLGDTQLNHYKSLSSFSYFGKGWTNRNQARVEAATTLLQAPPVPHPTPVPAPPVPDDPCSVLIHTLDPELQALVDIIAALDGFDGPTCQRLLAYASARFAA